MNHEGREVSLRSPRRLFSDTIIRLPSEYSNTVSRCRRKLRRKLLISFHMCLAFRVHRVHNEVLVR